MTEIIVRLGTGRTWQISGRICLPCGTLAVKICHRGTLPSATPSFLPWVPETFLVRFPVSGFGQHRKFPPHARKTSGTQGTSFQVGKNFENRKKHQRRRIAWVGQADFGKLELNNRNHGGKCQHLSAKRDQCETRSI